MPAGRCWPPRCCSCSTRPPRTRWPGPRTRPACRCGAARCATRAAAPSGTSRRRPAPRTRLAAAVRPAGTTPAPRSRRGDRADMFWVLDYLCLALILGGALLVVRLRNLTAAVMALSAVGTFIALLFVVLGAPDDAHSEIVVGAIALPVLYFVAIGKARTAVRDAGDLGDDTD